MKKIAMICPPLQGHLNPMKSIAYLLQEKGMQPVFIGIIDSSDKVNDFEHIVIGKQVFPKGSLELVLREITQSRGFKMGRIWQKEFLHRWSKVVCEELPIVLDNLNIDLMVIDQLDPASALVADKCNIRFKPHAMQWQLSYTERYLFSLRVMIIQISHRISGTSGKNGC